MKAWRPEEKLGLLNNPASTKRVNTNYTMENILAFVAKLKDLAPKDR